MSQPSLVFVNQHYAPDLVATARMLEDLAEHLVAEGFDVHVICSRGHYLSGKMDVPARETRNGVQVHRVWSTAFGRGTAIGRIVDYATFFCSAIWTLFRLRAADLAVMLTTPPLLPVVGALMKRVFGLRYGIWSMDLHPQAEVAAGMLTEDSILTRLLHAVNDTGYQNADFVVDLGAHMKERIAARGVQRQLLHTIPVWNRSDEVWPVSREDNPLRSKLGLEEKFVVMYSGNAGVAHRFDEVLDAMERLRDHPDIYFVFVGEGPQKKRIQRFADAHKIDNFRYLPYFPGEKLHESLSLADVHLLTLKPNMAGIAVPGKLYGIMAAGRPVLMVGPRDSEPADTIRDTGAGQVVDPTEPGSTDAVCEHLLHFYHDDDQRKRSGTRGREAFLQKYERTVGGTQWATLLSDQLHGSEVHA